MLRNRPHCRISSRASLWPPRSIPRRRHLLATSEIFLDIKTTSHIGNVRTVRAEPRISRLGVHRRDTRDDVRNRGDYEPAAVSAVLPSAATGVETTSGVEAGGVAECGSEARAAGRI